jgi:hypothetical protein
MQLIINHKYANEIMNFLYEERGILGNEEDLKDEPLVNILGNGNRLALIGLEIYLEKVFDFVVDLPTDLRLIEVPDKGSIAEDTNTPQNALKGQISTNDLNKKLIESAQKLYNAEKAMANLKKIDF